MRRAFPALCVMIILTSSAIVHGFWTGRWQKNQRLDDATARLAQLPIRIGTWDGEAMPLNPRELAITGATGYVLHRYVERGSGATLSVLIMCGPPGPLSVHTPDACYSGSGFEQVGETGRLNESGAVFSVYDFRKRDAAIPARLRVLHSWFADGSWIIARYPRVAFARQPLLYKMYIIRDLTRADEPLDKDAALPFLRELLPRLQKILQPPSS